jgi:hypothetical protein
LGCDSSKDGEKAVRTAIIFAALMASAATAAHAQYSSDIPGVPRASVPLHGSKQSRTEWEVMAVKLTGTNGDTMIFGTRIGVGRSYRVTSTFEMGFDFTLLQGSFTKLPTSVAVPPVSNKYAESLALYGLRIGGKLRPYSDVTPEGYGVDLAVAASFGPPLKPVFGVELKNDTATTGGYAGSSKETAPTLFNTLRSWVQIAGMASYRSQRLLIDGALVSETVSKDKSTTGEKASPLALYSGVAPRIGAVVRLTPGFAVGGSYWGDGAPPWRDAQVVGGRAEKATKLGAVITFGSRAESGTDIMVTSPTGAFSKSVRVYFRFRGTT